MKALRLLLPVSLLVAGTCSAATITAQAPTPSNSDPFNNANVISNSNLISLGSSAGNMFGGTGGVEPNNTLFEDGHPLGTFQVTFSLTVDQVISGYNLYVADDSSVNNPTNNSRSIIRFQLLQGATVLSDVTILNAGQSNTSQRGGANLTITDNFAPVLVTSAAPLQAIFYSNNAAVSNGPRVLELDGIAAAPEPGTLAMLAIGGLAVAFARRRKA